MGRIHDGAWTPIAIARPAAAFERFLTMRVSRVARI